MNTKGMLSRRMFVRLAGISAVSVSTGGLALFLTGCASPTNGTSADESAATTGDTTGATAGDTTGAATAGDTTGAATAAESKLLYVGGQNDYPPYSFFNSDNYFTGFDPEFVREVGKRLEGYTFEFNPIGWDASFIAIDSGRFQLFVDQIAITPEREKQYLFSIPYYQDETRLVIKKGRTDIKSLDDCQGKTFVSMAPTDTYSLIVEDYNAKHAADEQINIVYNQAMIGNEIYLNLDQGRSDFYLDNPIRANATIEQNNFSLEVVGEPIRTEPIAFLYPKTTEGLKLKETIDPIISELIADGTRDALIEKWLKGDWLA